MLDPKRNRIDYGEQLSPPEGYNLIKSHYSILKK